jgi:hypothetical protein
VHPELGLHLHKSINLGLEVTRFLDTTSTAASERQSWWSILRKPPRYVASSRSTSN